MAEGNGLLNRHRAKVLSRVQIPPSPPNQACSCPGETIALDSRLPGLQKSIRASANSHENPGEGQPIEEPNKDDE